MTALLLMMSALFAVSDVASAALPLRPDGRIKLVGDTTWRGNNTYNTTGAGQTRLVTRHRGEVADFQVSIQNDGRAATFAVKGSPGTANFPTTYRYNGNDVTARVVAGTFRLANLARNASRTLAVRVQVGNAAMIGSTRTVAVTTTATANPVKKDVVKAQVRVIALPNQAPTFPNPFVINSSIDFGAGTHDLEASVCTDPDGDLLTYTWSVTNGSIEPTTSDPSWVRARWYRLIVGGRMQAGYVTLTCEDPAGASDARTTWFSSLP